MNNLGQAAREAWEWLSEQYTYVDLDEWVMMPNHLHGIIVINECRRDSSRTTPSTRKPLACLIGAFKTVSTKRINNILHAQSEVIWQRNYYERIIRSEKDLTQMREYIENNPLKWSQDKYNPHNIRTS
ncbi:MAG: transposase [Chloroflexota bacterium]|nr:transposase [Chloroflexota bacterium]